MMERIAIVAATEMEIRPLLAFLEEKGSKLSANSYKLKDTIIDIAFTGIGILPTTLFIDGIFE